MPKFGQLLWHGLQVLITFHLVVLAWVFFRAASMKDALYILRKIWKHPFRPPGLTFYFGLNEALIENHPACLRLLHVGGTCHLGKPSPASQMVAPMNRSRFSFSL